MFLNGKPILVVGALKSETELLVSKLEDVNTIKLGMYDIYEGKINGYPVIAARTGIGIAKSASCTTLLLEKYEPSMLINIGIAGGITKNHHKKDLVIATETFNYNSYKSPYKELGEGSNSLDWEIMEFSDGGVDQKKSYSSTAELVNIIENIGCIYEHGDTFKGIVGSGDAWNREKDKLNFLDEVHNVACEDMELAAIYEVAEYYNIPKVSIKIMSDNELLGEDYEPMVSTYCQEYVYNLLKKMIDNKI